MQRPVTVDFNRENASLQILPSKPLLSSDKADENSLGLKHYLIPAYELQPISPAQNLVVIFHQPVKNVRRMLGSDVRDEFIHTGDIVINPANISHSACWNEETLFTLLFFEPELIARAAYEFIDPSRIELLPHFAQPDPVIYEIGHSLMSQLQTSRQVSKIYADSVALFLATHLLEHYCVCENNIEENNDILHQKDLRQVVDYVDAHLDQNLSLTDLANLVGRSNYHFARLFKKTLGVSPHQYLIERRTERATRLLVNTNLSMAEIAQFTGFSSHSHFCLTFRKHMSVTPALYRKMNALRRSSKIEQDFDSF
jgi:AraC family transcriptional regulator